MGPPGDERPLGHSSRFHPSESGRRCVIAGWLLVGPLTRAGFALLQLAFALLLLLFLLLQLFLSFLILIVWFGQGSTSILASLPTSANWLARPSCPARFGCYGAIVGSIRGSKPTVP